MWLKKNGEVTSASSMSVTRDSALYYKCVKYVSPGGARVGAASARASPAWAAGGGRLVREEGAVSP